eukprot:TRINITY_DN9154_c0_g1_i1.p1 TRINITY_DN9154_c0_g1~~TRINITY_DN9154_c0_g1_i1.p1  ORF type:complete len:210 (+),score=54.35 TRINITY_DN9154_c0_g1_i1:54-632(+)
MAACAEECFYGGVCAGVFAQEADAYDSDCTDSGLSVQSSAAESDMSLPPPLILKDTMLCQADSDASSAGTELQPRRQWPTCTVCGRTCNSNVQLDDHMAAHRRRGELDGDEACTRKWTLCRHFSCGRKCPMAEGTCMFAHGWAELDTEMALCPIVGCGVELRSEDQFVLHMTSKHQTRRRGRSQQRYQLEPL